MTDRELLAEYARTGSEEAFRRLAERHAAKVYASCLGVLGEAHAAEDAAQATFLVLARKAKRLARGTVLSGWLFLTAQTCARQWRRAEARRARREREAAAMHGSEETSSSWEKVRPHLGDALARLPRVQREALALCYLDGRSRAEAAAEMGCSVKTLDTRVTRGLAKLRTKLARRGAPVAGAALVAFLGTNAAGPAPAALAASCKAAVFGKAAVSFPVQSTVEGAMKAMFWVKAKLCAAALAAVAVVGTGTGVALSSAGAGESGSGAFRKEKDNKGREWQLDDWKGSRPYKKDLKEREADYIKKYGESWDGPVYGNRIVTPGNWKWETVVELPEPLATQLKTRPADFKKKYWRNWGGSWPGTGVYAPGAGEVTDIYGGAGPGYVHYDTKTKKTTFIGSPTETGNKDGLGSEVRIANGYGAMQFTVDVVSGRVYWLQSVSRKSNQLRFVEKLLPYKGKTGDKTYLLPAFLDFKDQYKMVKGPGGEELEPVMKDGKRAAPTFAVRTTKLGKIFGIVRFPGKSPRPLITNDGKAIWLTTKQTWPRKPYVEFENTKLFDIETGKVIQELKLTTPFPGKGEKGAGDGVGSHGAVCTGIDGNIYICQHCGCSGGPMRLIGMKPDGILTYLYDSVLGINMAKRGSPQWDGPADALNLSAPSTLHQVQCPRTGGIINGGWDNTGIRRYHDGFVTSIVNGSQGNSMGRPEWKGKPFPGFSHHNCETSVAPNGDIYVADPKTDPQRIWRMYRTDWPKEQPEYGYGEKFMPKAKLEELMLEYAKKYIANYAELSKIY